MASKTRNLRNWVLLSVTMMALIMAALVLSCKSDSGNPYGGGGGGGGNPGANEVWIQNMAFNPGNRTISTGTTITWTNKDAVAHTVTGTNWGSGNLAQNGTFSHTFSTAGAYPYHCTIHPSMTATITVQ